MFSDRRPHTAHLSVKINKVKDGAVIFWIEIHVFSVSNINTSSSLKKKPLE